MSDAESTPPTCFISYSYDDTAHKAWVAELAAQLRRDGVTTVLDQWELAPGDRLPEFMEKAIRENQYVLIICTPNYKARSDKRMGGVGYEGDIIAGEILTNADQRKFIPVLRNGSRRDAVPTSLAGKYDVDLRGEPSSATYPIQYQDLLNTLLGQRPVAPPVNTAPSRRTAAAVHRNVPPEPTDVSQPAAAPIKITGVIVDQVSTPLQDGSRGSALYRVPFRLSREPSYEWARVFVDTWDHPPTMTSMHRPGTATVAGEVVWLNRTTIEEVQEHHRQTLMAVVERTNAIVAELEAERHRRENERRRHVDEHSANVRRKAADIDFDN
jgi:hypothetical protein